MFTPQTLAFLEENHFRADKAWFTAHKQEYQQYVQQPLLQLAAALAPTAAQIDSALVTAPKTAAARIYRDLRFAKGGSPYREMLWVSFRHDKKVYPCRPELYFVFSPREVFYGCGYYSAPAASMAALRRLILENDAAFVRAQAVLAQHPDFVLEGDVYKKYRYTAPTPAQQNWLQHKTVCCSCRPPLTALFAPDLAEKVAQTFLQMQPVYELLMKAEKNLRATCSSTNLKRRKRGTFVRKVN